MPRPKLYVDSKCEIAELLRPYADHVFRGFDTIAHNENDIYVLSRMEFKNNATLIRPLIDRGVKLVYSNPFEGSETLAGQLTRFGLSDLFLERRILVIGGGDMRLEWPNLRYDLFVSKPHNFAENLAAIKRSDEIFSQVNKPFNFLFLNGRARDHRKYLVERLSDLGLLDQSLYTWLDTSSIRSRAFDSALTNRSRAHRFLPEQYEHATYQANVNRVHGTDYVKLDLFNNEWGEIYLNADAYVDTYFSLVTETVYNYPHSFRTEKIWKPIAMGHPWICVANMGYYRDLRALGFQTFNTIIDEGFDAIEGSVARMERCIRVIEDIHRNGLQDFLAQCQDICKYNQQHMIDLRDQVNKDFPDQFFKFLRDYGWTT